MDDQKELYKLWVEYLKRSENYKAFCEERLEWQRSDEPLSLSKLAKFMMSQIAETYSAFGDIHSVDYNFNDRWGLRRQELDLLKKHPIPNAVDDYMNERQPSLQTDLTAFFKSPKEFSDAEIITFFPRFLNRKLDGRNMMLLEIDLLQSRQNIKAGFKELMDSDVIKEKIENAKDARWEHHHKNIKPTGQASIKDLQKYLKVYDMWEEKVQNRKPGDPGGWDQIIKYFEPGRSASNEGDRRLYQDYRDRAKNIIANVEMGFFPGDY
jgi:hypothetical protein